jgi:hypothetical protein
MLQNINRSSIGSLANADKEPEEDIGEVIGLASIIFTC